MKYNPDIHHRHSIRLKNYDYSQSAAYFITICTHQKECIFGEIINDEMHLNSFGNIAQSHWQKLTNYYSYLELDEFIIMPNHLHGILILNDIPVNCNIHNEKRAGLNVDVARAGFDVDVARAGLNVDVERAGFDVELSPVAKISAKPAPTDYNIQRKGISEIIRGFKTFSAKQINRMRRCRNVPVWQRNFYEHIIRNESDFNRIREYILNNPKNWLQDNENQL